MGLAAAGGCSSMVEQKPSKLTTRVRFPSPAPAFAKATAGKPASAPVAKAARRSLGEGGPLVAGTPVNGAR